MIDFEIDIFLGGGMCKSRLSPMVILVKSLKKYFYETMNSIMLVFDNEMVENMNLKIQKVKKKVCWFRFFERFQNAILFHFGGLDLYPALLIQ